LANNDAVSNVCANAAEAIYAGQRIFLLSG
jgi:hypothetical protein